MLRRVSRAHARYWRAGLVALLLHGPLSALAGAETRHVLVLSSAERPFAPQSSFADALMPELIRASREPIDIVEMSVQDVRSSGVAPDESIAQRLHSAFSAQPLDLVITIGGPAAVFAQEFRQQLFPATPILIAGVDRRFVEHGTFTDNETTVATQHDPARMIDEILRLLPETRTVMVVIGASQVERFWLREMQREFKQFDGRLQFVFTNELSFSQIVERSRSLPPQSAIFFAVLALDAVGDPVVQDEALTSLYAAANAPLFALRGLGRGTVGGPLLDNHELSRTTARVALRMLAGESPHEIKTPIQRAGVPTFDWRELRRWNVEESRLAPGSVVLFREPPLWQRDRRVVILGALVAVVPAIGILLLISFVKRGRAGSHRSVATTVAPWDVTDNTTLQRAGAELSNLSRRLLQAHDQEAATVAKKLREDVGQRVATLTLQLQTLKGAPNASDVQAAIADISAKLAHVVGELVALPDPVYDKLELLGLVPVCKSLCGELSAEHDVAVHFQDDNVPATLPPDIALALFRVLQEATLNAAIHSGERDVWVSLHGTPGEVRLQIVDWGVGFDTQPDLPSAGVGLVAIRERLKLVNGSCLIVSRPKEGTRVEAWVPIP